MKRSKAVPRPWGRPVLFIVIGASLIMRLMLDHAIGKSALFYIAVPALITLALLRWQPTRGRVWWQRYVVLLRNSLIVFVTSAMVLFEGFICMAMFLPIYLGVVLMIFLIECLYRLTRAHRRARLGVHVLPLLLVVLSTEGVVPHWPDNRFERITVQHVLPFTPVEFVDRLQAPMRFDADRPAFLSLFPMPVRTSDRPMVQGAVHQTDFRYARWFVTNVHEGHMLLQLEEVSENRIKVRFLEDTSYIASYMNLIGTELTFEVLPDEQTLLTFSIEYERTLDPSWYFGPLQRLAMTQMADYLILEVFAHE